MKVKARKTGKISFDIEQDGFTYVVDAHPMHGGEGRGPSPKGLLLGGLVGCTGMDVVSILQKMHLEYDDLEISAEAEQTEEHPVVFKSITLIFRFKGSDDIDTNKIKRAVELSETRYCGVSAMLKKNNPINKKIYLNDRLINEE